MKRLFIALVAPALASGAIAACGDDRPPPAGNGSSGGSHFEGGATSDAPSESSLSERANPERLCEPLSQEGSEVEELGEGSPAPEATGGTIASGTYVLFRLVVHLGAGGGGGEGDAEAPLPPGPTGNAGRATLRVVGGAFRFNEAYGSTGALPADTTRGVSFSPKGTSLELIDECPAQGAVKTLPYSVAGNTIAFHPDTNHSQIFQKVP